MTTFPDFDRLMDQVDVREGWYLELHARKARLTHVVVWAGKKLMAQAEIKGDLGECARFVAGKCGIVLGP